MVCECCNVMGVNLIKLHGNINLGVVRLWSEKGQLPTGGFRWTSLEIHVHVIAKLEFTQAAHPCVIRKL